MLPDRLLEILNSCQGNTAAHRFPPTEIYNEGWMLRLVLDAIKNDSTRNNHPLQFFKDAEWFSEARLSSPFLRKPKKDLRDDKKDVLGEGYTNADGVIGHFRFSEGRKARLELDTAAHQFIVVEAKMLSNLSKGVTNDLEYNQAARNIACMAETIRNSGMKVDALDSVGFFVICPRNILERKGARNIKRYLAEETLTKVIDTRLSAYIKAGRCDDQMRFWKAAFDELLARLLREDRLKAISWEDLFKDLGHTRKELEVFYEACLVHAKTKKQFTKRKNPLIPVLAP
jgi:hypothetical protein